MPLKCGRSAKTLSKNIRELIDSWKKTGKIGSASPGTLADARKMAAAVAYKKSRE